MQPSSALSASGLYHTECMTSQFQDYVAMPFPYFCACTCACVRTKRAQIITRYACWHVMWKLPAASSVYLALFPFSLSTITWYPSRPPHLSFYYLILSTIIHNLRLDTLNMTGAHSGPGLGDAIRKGVNMVHVSLCIS